MHTPFAGPILTRLISGDGCAAPRGRPDPPAVRTAPRSARAGWRLVRPRPLGPARLMFVRRRVGR